jgi:hypothetical protein
MKPRAFNHRQALKKRWYVLWPVTAAILLYPINNFPLRVSTLLALAALWVGTLYFYWQRKGVRYMALLVAAVALAFLLVPGRNFNSKSLRAKYVNALQRYEGTRYVWGGEGRLGIDCSGLVRSALIVANYQQGIRTLNPRLVREGISLWWHDCSAQALGEEYRHGTHVLFEAPSINETAADKLLPGDIVVMDDGVHTLAYLGNTLWIEADPDAKRVIKVETPSTNTWFNEPIKVVRWTEFEAEQRLSD